MRILVYEPYISFGVGRNLGVKLVELKDLFNQSDIITLHAALIEETCHLLSRAELKLIKEGALIVNTARAGSSICKH